MTTAVRLNKTLTHHTCKLLAIEILITFFNLLEYDPLHTPVISRYLPGQPTPKYQTLVIPLNCLVFQKVSLDTHLPTYYLPTHLCYVRFPIILHKTVYLHSLPTYSNRQAGSKHTGSAVTHPPTYQGTTVYPVIEGQVRSDAQLLTSPYLPTLHTGCSSCMCLPMLCDVWLEKERHVQGMLDAGCWMLSCEMSFSSCHRPPLPPPLRVWRLVGYT